MTFVISALEMFFLTYLIVQCYRRERSVPEEFAEVAAAIGLEVNWDKTKVRALGTQQPDT